MTSPVGVTDRAASLLQTDPALGRLLGARDASAVGHRPLIPVLEIAAGPWTVPAPAALGDGTFALIVLTGALLRAPQDGDARLLGPGDLFEPWAPPAAEWVACTPVRAAVIGEALLGAVAPWPLAAAHVQLRAAARPARAGMLVDREAAGTADHRLSELLWRLAIRWGRSDGDGVVLPLALAPAALAHLGDLSAGQVTAGLEVLDRARTARRRADGTWRLRGGGGPGRLSDRLRERAAAAIARARDGREKCAELMDEAAADVLRSADRRGRRACG